jgi:hypothetical protein
LEILTIISQQAKKFIPFQLIHAKITTNKITKYLSSNSRQSNENLNYNSRRIPWKRSLWSFPWTKDQSWSYSLSLCTCFHSLSTRMKKTKFNSQRVRRKLPKKIPKRQVWYSTKKLLKLHNYNIIWKSIFSKPINYSLKLSINNKSNIWI